MKQDYAEELYETVVSGSESLGSSLLGPQRVSKNLRVRTDILRHGPSPAALVWDKVSTLLP